jgi:hypothetical protein
MGRGGSRVSLDIDDVARFGFSDDGLIEPAVAVSKQWVFYGETGLGKAPDWVHNFVIALMVKPEVKEYFDKHVLPNDESVEIWITAPTEEEATKKFLFILSELNQAPFDDWEVEEQ